MLKKLKLYQQQGKKLVSIYREDKSDLKNVLIRKLSRHIQLPAPTAPFGEGHEKHEDEVK